MSLIKSGLVVTLYTFLSRIFGFLREIFIANSLGVGLLTDCFNVAFKLPNFFRRFFAEGAFSAAFIPIFSNKMTYSTKEELKIFSSRVFTLMVLILVIFTILLEIFMPTVIELLAPGFRLQSEQAFLLAIKFARICMPYLFFISIIALYGGILNSHNKFAANAFVPVILNIVMIISLILDRSYTETPAHALSYGVLAAGICQYIFLAIIIYKQGWLPKFVKPRFTNEIKKLFKNMGPAILSNAIAQLNLIVDTMVCSPIVGAISTLYYADRIIHLPISLIGTAMATVLLPELAKHTKDGKHDYASKIQYNALKFASFIVFPCAFTILAASQEIIFLIYERGLFTREHTINTGIVILVFGLSIPAYVISKIYVARLLALQDTKTPFKITLVGLIVNIVLDLLLVNPYGAAGVAFASTITAWLICILYGFISHRKRIFYHETKLLLIIAKVILSSFALYLVILALTTIFNNYIYHHSKFWGLLVFIIIATIAWAIYFALLYLQGLINKENFKRSLIKRKKNELYME